MNLTIFDLDNTLIDGDSDYAWGQFMVGKGLVDAEDYSRQNDRFYEDYKNKRLDIRAYQRFVLSPLSKMNREQRQQLHQEFMSSFIARMRLAKADALIAERKLAGDDLLIITATNRFVAGPIGPWLGIDEVLATEPEEIDGHFTGEITGTPCFQEGKIVRLRAWLEQQTKTYQHTRFYSDSINDLPLLEHCNQPIVVDADDRLTQHAINQGWERISLR